MEDMNMEFNIKQNDYIPYKIQGTLFIITDLGPSQIAN